MRPCFLLLPAALLFAGTPVSAQSLSAIGVAGYLSEWQLDARLSPTSTSGEFAGPMSIKHVGLCTHDGPDETTTELILKITDAKSWFAKAKSEVRASFVIDGSECRLTGSFSGTYRGAMDCTGTKGVPVEISIK